jgi:hypothetical protein
MTSSFVSVGSARVASRVLGTGPAVVLVNGTGGGDGPAPLSTYERPPCTDSVAEVVLPKVSKILKAADAVFV